MQLSYPKLSVLLEQYGSDAQGRASARRELANHLHAQAETAVGAAIRKAGRSYRCGEGDHSRTVLGSHLGCRNDGSSCICECHDPTTDLPTEGNQP